MQRLAKLLSLHTEPYRFQSDVILFQASFLESTDAINVKEAMNIEQFGFLPAIENLTLMKVSRDIFIQWKYLKKYLYKFAIFDNFWPGTLILILLKRLN